MFHYSELKWTTVSEPIPQVIFILSKFCVINNLVNSKNWLRLNSLSGSIPHFYLSMEKIIKQCVIFTLAKANWLSSLTHYCHQETSSSTSPPHSCVLTTTIRVTLISMYHTINILKFLQNTFADVYVVSFMNLKSCFHHLFFLLYDRHRLLSFFHNSHSFSPVARFLFYSRYLYWVLQTDKTEHRSTDVLWLQSLIGSC